MKYITLVDRFYYPAGTIVYDYKGHDYGCSRDDTYYTKQEHISVTDQVNGGSPFFTIAEDDLEELVDMVYIIYNSIRTPDGTYLTCKHNHDFKVHLDKLSGETYMNDGLGYCIRRSVNKVPYIDYSVNSEDEHELQRNYFRWCTYGKDGKQEKKYVFLKDMSNMHIENILRTQKHLEGTYVKELLMNELAYRDINNILIED